jgi:hypothetical protein
MGTIGRFPHLVIFGRSGWSFIYAIELPPRDAM